MQTCLKKSKGIFFADDTTIYHTNPNLNLLYKNVNTELEAIDDWFKANKLLLSKAKTKYIIFHPRQKNISTNTLNIRLGNDIIERSQVHKFLGILLDEHLQWVDHIKHITAKISSALYIINATKNMLTKESKKILYYTMAYPYLTYGIELWGSTNKSNLKTLNVLHRKLIRTVSAAKYNDAIEPILQNYHFLQIEELQELAILKIMHQYVQKDLPTAVMQLFTLTSDVHRYNTRRSHATTSYPTQGHQHCCDEYSTFWTQTLVQFTLRFKNYTHEKLLCQKNVRNSYWTGTSMILKHVAGKGGLGYR